MLNIFPDEWLITLVYLLILFLIVVVAKISSVLVASKTLAGHGLFLVMAPVLSVKSWQRVGSIRRHEIWLLLRKGLVIIPVMSAYYFFGPKLTSGLSWWLISYLAIAPFWLFLETVQFGLEIYCLMVGKRMPPMNRQPLSAKTVAEFWGRRWNRHFGDWLIQVCFRPFARRPILAMFITFGISGLIHELLVSVVLWYVYRVNYFGWMMAYFLIQAMAILLERRWFKSTPDLNRAFVWLTIIAPVPLILNQGTLLIFHLTILP